MPTPDRAVEAVERKQRNGPPSYEHTPRRYRLRARIFLKGGGPPDAHA